MPQLKRVAVLIDPIDVVDAADVLRETEAAARRLGLQMEVLEVHGAKDLEAAFARAPARPRAGIVHDRHVAASRAGSPRWRRSDRLRDGRRIVAGGAGGPPASPTAPTSTTWCAARCCRWPGS